jgi:hypothetical protein
LIEPAHVKTTADEDALKAECFALARTAMWTQKPIDSEAITRLAEAFFNIARARLSEPLNIDLPLITRAMQYVAEAHGMPTGDDTRWFDLMLMAVLEVARPNSGLTERGQEYLYDMLDGITGMLEDDDKE